MTLFVPKGPKRYRHQTNGLRKLIKTAGVGALLFDPGTGKTATTLDFLSILALKAKPDEHGVREVRVLVVCPLVAVDTWIDQAEQYVSDQVNVWAEVLSGSIDQRAQAMASRGGRAYKATLAGNRHHPRAVGVSRSIAWYARADGRESERPITRSEGPDGLGTAKPRLVLLVVNLDTFSSRQKYGKSTTKADLLLDAVKRLQPAAVVIDEMHKIKGATSNASRLLARIGEKVPRRIGLTGTVMPAGPMDVFGQWRFLDPYAFGLTQADGTKARATLGGFQERFMVTGGYMGREVLGYRNLEEMRATMALISSVARKGEALDLPPTTDVVVPVHLNAAELKAYREMKKELTTKLGPAGRSTATALSKLTQMLRLRQITGGHLPDDQGVDHILGDSKVVVIDDIVNSTLAAEKRVVIFCVFSAEIDALSRKLQRKGQTVLVVTGATPHGERIAMRKRFGSDDPERIVLVAQIQTLSLAVNELVTASHAVFGSLSQKRDEMIQARDRLNRVGQKLPVTYWYALAPKSVDEVIMRSHQESTDLEQAMLAHIYSEE